MRKTHVIRHTAVIVFLTALLFCASGCARLPDYALPQSGVVLNDPQWLREAFTYRKLVRADFKAATLPAERAIHRQHAVCAARCRSS